MSCLPGTVLFSRAVHCCSATEQLCLNLFVLFEPLPLWVAPLITLTGSRPCSLTLLPLLAEETDVAVGAAAIQHTLHMEQPEVFDLLTRTRDSLLAPSNDSSKPAGDSGPAAAAEASSIPPCARPGAARDALEIVFLGTGAAIPSKYRNVTSVGQ